MIEILNEYKSIGKFERVKIYAYEFILVLISMCFVRVFFGAVHPSSWWWVYLKKLLNFVDICFELVREEIYWLRKNKFEKSAEKKSEGMKEYGITSHSKNFSLIWLCIAEKSLIDHYKSSSYVTATNIHSSVSRSQTTESS